MNEVCICKGYYISSDCSISTSGMENDRAKNSTIQSGDYVYFLASNEARNLKSEIVGLENANATLYVLNYKESSSVPSSMNYDSKYILELGAHTYKISKLDYSNYQKVIISILNPKLAL